jgi:hypothetical protein
MHFFAQSDLGQRTEICSALQSSLTGLLKLLEAQFKTTFVIRYFSGSLHNDKI